MDKSELKEIIRQEISAILSESTKTLKHAGKVYFASVTAFEEMANKLKDRKLVRLAREIGKLSDEVHHTLEYDYPGSVDESSVKDVYRQNIPAAAYHELEIGEMALNTLVKNTRGDRPGSVDKDIVKYFNAHRKLMAAVKKHLHREYPDWEKMHIYEDIRNSKKSKANLVKALKKFKKGAKVHYFPLSGGNYVMVGPKGVQTKDKEAVNVQIRKIGTYDADNPNQVSVGIELNNGHEATWNGEEFEIDDLGCPLLLGKG